VLSEFPELPALQQAFFSSDSRWGDATRQQRLMCNIRAGEIKAAIDGLSRVSLDFLCEKLSEYDLLSEILRSDDNSAVRRMARD